MVVERWRAFTAVALWKGQAAHVTTGSVSSAATQPQWGNCAPGTMEITKTGTEKTAATMNRFLRSLIRRCAGVVSSAGSRCSFSARRVSSAVRSGVVSEDACPRGYASVVPSADDAPPRVPA